MSAKTDITNENKLLLLYVLYQMDMPMTWQQLLDFAVDDYMDFMSFQLYLTEMVGNILIEKEHSEENNTDYYSLTDEGITCVRCFHKRVPESKLKSVINYVRKNRSKIRNEYSVSANYFCIGEGEYIVKCSVIENDVSLMELNLTVVTKEQAKQVRRNWKAKVTQVYNNVLKELLTDSAATDKTE